MSRNSRRKKSQQQRIIQEQVSSAIRSHSFVIQAEKPHSLKHSWLKSLHLSWKLICSFIVALVTIGGLTSYFVLLPKIDVQPGISLNTKSPFETRFFLQNQSVFPIYNVLHQTAWTEGMPDPKIKRWVFLGLSSDIQEKLSPDAKYSMRLVGGASAALLPKTPYSKSALLLVTIKYQYPLFWKWKNQKKTFQFFSKEDSDGNYQWCPVQTDVPDELWNPTNIPVLQ